MMAQGTVYGCVFSLGLSIQVITFDPLLIHNSEANTRVFLPCKRQIAQNDGMEIFCRENWFQLPNQSSTFRFDCVPGS